MPPLGEIHAEDGVAGIEKGEIGGHIGLGAGVGLDIGVFGLEQLLCSRNGQDFQCRR